MESLLPRRAAAAGTIHGNRAAGARPSDGSFNFHPRKIVTTGEGGILITHNRRLGAPSSTPAQSREVVIIEQMRRNGVGINIGACALHAQKSYARFGYCPGDLPNAWHVPRTRSRVRFSGL